MRKRLCFLLSFFLVLGLVLTNAANAQDPNLVGWWKFDDGSGTTAKDSSGRGIDGVLIGDPKWGMGGPHKSGFLSFDGSDDYVCIDGSFEIPLYSG